MDRDVSLPPWALAAGVGAVVAAVGSVLPWATLRFDPDVAELAGVPRTQTLGGLDGDGRITLALALVTLLVLVAVTVRSRPGPKTAVWTALVGVLVVVAAVMDYRSLDAFRARIRQQAAQMGPDMAGSRIATIETGPGLYVLALGGLLLVGAGGYALVRYWRRGSGSAVTAGE